MVKSTEEISKDVAKNRGNYEVPEGYNLIEGQCYMALMQLMGLYGRGEINKERAAKEKARIFKEYDEEAKMFDFNYDMFKDAVESVKRTENDRIKLHKMLNKKDEVKLEEMVETCMNIICEVFPGEFYKGGVL